MVYSSKALYTGGLGLSCQDSDGKTIMKDRKYLDFLDILLTAKDDKGVGLSDMDIRNEVDTFLFEGEEIPKRDIFHS